MSQINRSSRNRWSSGTSTSRYFMMEVLLLLLITCSSLLQYVTAAHVAVAGGGENDARFVYNKSKTDVNAAESTDTYTNVKLLEENETDPFPMDFYRQLNNITSISEFIEKIIENPDSIDPKLGIHENLRQNVERDSSVKAIAANCIPEPTVVELQSNNQSYYYYPKCTRVKRCGGCCNTYWMSCQPTKTEFVSYKVYRYCYDQGAKFCGYDAVVVEKHLDCKCDCRVKPQDCNPNQVYEECRCRCKNTDDRDKCLGLDNAEWDDKNCQCNSRYVQNQFIRQPHNDTNVAEPSPSLADRRRFIVKAIPVESDNSTIYEV